MRLPVRSRLTLVSAVLMSAVLLAFGSFVYLRFAADLLELVDEGLRTRSEVLTAAMDGGLPPGTGQPADPTDAIAQLIGADGSLIESTPGFTVPLAPPAGLAAVEGAYLYESELVTNARVVPIRLLAVRLDDGRLLVVGTALEDQRDALQRLRAELLIGGAMAVALATAVGWLVAGEALRPVERLRRDAEALSAAEPGRRLPVPATGDELARLAESLNRMLARVEAALHRERRFVSDASHELRTPLANLKVELELALRRARSIDELTDALGSAVEETDRLTRLSEDLLVLARASEGQLVVRRERIDLGDLVEETAASFAARAGVGTISLRTSVVRSVLVEVDPVRIRQAVGNLIDNGLRHTPPGGQVDVLLTELSGNVTVLVSDSGEGFPPAFLEHAFEPFSRSDSGRARTDGGAGLGLAITKAIVEAHGGSVEASNGSDSGARVVIRLPA